MGISITSVDLYNDIATINHVKSLAMNRTASSTGETEALNYIKDELIKGNINPDVEHFNWAGPLRILMRMSYLIMFAYLILFRLFLVIIAYFVLKNAFATTRGISLIKKEESKNVLVRIPAKEEIENKSLVMITAHYDSISVKLSYKFQIIVFFFYRFIIFFYVALVVVFSLLFLFSYLLDLDQAFSSFLTTLITSASIVGVFVSIPILYLVFSENPSSGSIDNASGVAISIELAKLFKKNPLEKTDLLFIWTGAEEWGLKGSKDFCKRHFKSLSQNYDFNRSININLDMVGTYIGLFNASGIIKKRRINSDLNDILQTTAETLEISLDKYNRMVKPKSDYRIFQKYSKKFKKNLQIGFFHSSKDSKYIHSIKDTPDKCSSEILNGCLNICFHALRSIDLKM
ncbi:MAG: M28 family metallopeptidase [Promethearchaeota archaeon]|jgi:hypothetical protein